MGPWEGLMEGEGATGYAKEFALWHTRPDTVNLLGWETLSAVAERVSETLSDALGRGGTVFLFERPRQFLFFTSWPEPGPVAEVLVAIQAANPPGSWVPVVAALASILASTATVVIAVSR